MDGAAAAFARLYELLDEIERSHPDLPQASRRKIVRAMSSLLTQSKRGEVFPAASASRRNRLADTGTRTGSVRLLGVELDRLEP